MNLIFLIDFTAIFFFLFGKIFFVLFLVKRYGLKHLEYQGYRPDVLIYAMLIQLSKNSVFVCHVALQI